VRAVSADAATVRWKRILSISLAIGFDGDEATASGIAQKIYSLEDISMSSRVTAGFI